MYDDKILEAVSGYQTMFKFLEASDCIVFLVSVPCFLLVYVFLTLYRFFVSPAQIRRLSLSVENSVK